MTTLRKHLEAIRDYSAAVEAVFMCEHAVAALAILDASDVFYPADLAYGDPQATHRLVPDPEAPA